MFRQRLRLPHHLTFGVLPRISRRPQRPSCSRSRTRFPSDRRTLLPLGSALTSLPSRCFFFFITLPHPLPAPTHGHVFERRVLSKELLFEAVVRVRESLILSLTIKFFAVSFPLRRSPVLLFTEVLESFAGLRSQFNRPSSFVLTKKFPRSATRKLSLDDNLKFRARERV